MGKLGIGGVVRGRGAGLDKKKPEGIHLATGPIMGSFLAESETVQGFQRGGREREYPSTGRGGRVISSSACC